VGPGAGNLLCQFFTIFLNHASSLLGLLLGGGGVELYIHAGLMFVGGIGIFRARRTAAILGSGVLLAWATACFFLDYIYPPFQVTLTYLLLFLTAGYFGVRGSVWVDRPRFRGAVLAGAVLTTAVVGLGFFLEARDVISMVSQTSYPGRRFMSGGGWPPWFLFSNNFFVKNPFAALANTCESANFFHLFPVAFAGAGALALQRRRRPDFFVICLFTYALINLVYTYFGFPEIVAKLTMFGMDTPNRTAIGLGVADFALVVYAVSHGIFRDLEERRAHVVIVLWVVVLFVIGQWLIHHVPGVLMRHVLLACLVNAILAYGLLRDRRWFLPTLAAISFSYTIGFNPWVRGGNESLRQTPLAQKMGELSSPVQPRARWVVYGVSPERGGLVGVLGNLPRILGIPSIGGYHSHPQLELWKKFDPSGQYYRAYNQCAFVRFFPPRPGEAASFVAGTGDVMAFVDPRSPIFSELGVEYFLVVRDKEGDSIPPVFEEAPFRKVFSAPRAIIYRRVDSSRKNE
jgi:hypothetical protein